MFSGAKKILKKLKKSISLSRKRESSTLQSNQIAHNQKFESNNTKKPKFNIKNSFWKLQCEPDGNCQFNAIAKAIAISQHDQSITAASVRSQIADYFASLDPTSGEFCMALEATKFSFGDATLGRIPGQFENIREPADLANYFSKSGVFGNFATLQAARLIFDVDFYAVGTATGVVTKVEGDIVKDNVILLLFNSEAKHFDLLARITYPQNRRMIQTVFSREELDSFVCESSTGLDFYVPLENLPLWKVANQQDLFE